ncbi:hypothetical protein QUF90_05185 [Desulfococcaceae bacterium HSG9]|nr:hypothetical protein [Desulfococcaceae bacterium HSG9]
MNSIAEAYRKFAKSNNLYFKFNYGEYPCVLGVYRGHNFLLNTFTDILNMSDEENKIGTTIKITKKTPLMNSEKCITAEDAIRRLWAIFPFNTQGKVKAVGKRYKTISLKSYIGIRSANELELASNQLVNLFKIYFELSDIGGEAVLSLSKALHDRRYSRAIIWPLIKDIAAETDQRIKLKTSSLLCNKCMAFCSSHKVRPPLSVSLIAVKYYGCRLCHQSRDFIEGRSVAVLDNLMTEEWSLHDDVISVNWLIYRKPFDFHEVRIIQASDREVEEFVMQVGNDNDPVRRPLYKKMRCTVASDCELTENTLRVLCSMFGKVEVK